MAIKPCTSPPQQLGNNPNPLPLVPEAPFFAVQALAPPLAPFARFNGVSTFNVRNTVNLYLCATLVRATYAPTAAQFTAAARAAWGPATTVTFSPNGAPSVPGYGIAITPSGDAVVCISGTTNLGQWLEQTVLGQLVFTQFAPLDTAQALQTYYNAAVAIDTALRAACPLNNNVLLCGHSMGGAVAAVLHYKQAWNPRTGISRLVTFANPKPGDTVLSLDSPSGIDIVARLACQGDFIPGLPPSSEDIPKLLIPTLPPAMLTALNYWDQFQQINETLQYVDSAGVLTYGDDPSLIVNFLGAVVQAAAGNPVQFSTVHNMPAFASRLRVGIDSFYNQIQQGWAQPAQLDSVNATLQQMGI